MAIIPIAKMVNMMAMIQSVSPIESAAKDQTRLFIVYVAVLVIGGLAAAALTILVFRAGNSYQGAVRADADARIAEAGTRAVTANAEAAKANEGLGKSNAEIARLTKEAEQAKAERAEADKQIAIAKADAARAKEGIANAEAVSAKASVEVARLQVVVANAETKLAQAEKALLELQERIKPRRFTTEQEKNLVAALKASPEKGLIEITCVMGDGEGFAFASQIDRILKAADWPTSGANQGVFSPNNPIGFFVEVRSADSAPKFAGALQHAFSVAGITLEGILRPGMAEGHVQIVVGNKP
jgi:hypothetical protein